MARREGRPDAKETALAAARCLNPHPEQVRDAEFLSSEFFDARDVVQVKYEMVRKVKAEGAPVTAAAAAFGYSRPSYYEAAAALERSGLEALVPARPGPRAGHKLTEEILAWAEDQLAADPALRPAQLPTPIEQVRVGTSNSVPDVLVAMRWSAEKSETGAPGLLVAEGGKKGKGSHGSLSHFDMHNTLVAAGPDFKSGFIDELPSGNADLAPTILHLMDIY